MTRQEFAQVLALIDALWPHQAVRDDTAAAWWADLGALDQDIVVNAVRALYRHGREFAPNSAHILGEIADQTEAAPSFGEAWEQILAAIRRHGARNAQRIVDGLEHPAVAELAAQLPLRELGMAPESQLTTWHAQTRERYRGIVARRRRAITHHDLPAATLRPQLRGGEGRPIRSAGDAIAELLPALSPASEDQAA